MELGGEGVPEDLEDLFLVLRDEEGDGVGEEARDEFDELGVEQGVASVEEVLDGGQGALLDSEFEEEFFDVELVFAFDSVDVD